MNKILYNIDFLKIVFINAIVFHHLYNSATGIWNTGGLAVELFFIISGFLFCLTFKNTTSTYDFVAKKLIRFFPLLFVTDIILSMFKTFNLSTLFDDMFLLSQTGLTNHTFGYNHPVWFICVLFWILLLFFYIKKNTSEQTSNIILFVLMLFSVYMYANNIDHYRVFRGMSSISIGYFSALIAKELNSKFSNAKTSFFLSVVEIVLFSFLSYTLFYKSIINITQLMFLMGLLCMLFYIKKGYFSMFLDKPIFSKVSTYVFPVFITQSLVYYANLPIFKFINNTFPNPIIKYGVLMASCWVLAFVLYLVVQVPCEKILYRKFLNIENKTK